MYQGVIDACVELNLSSFIFFLSLSLSLSLSPPLPPPLFLIIRFSPFPTVSNNLHAVEDLPATSSPNKTLALPEFLLQLQQHGRLLEGEGQGASLVDQCCEMYNGARHKDGVSQAVPFIKN